MQLNWDSHLFAESVPVWILDTPERSCKSTTNCLLKWYSRKLRQTKLQKTESFHCSIYFKPSESSWQKPEGQMFVYIKILQSVTSQPFWTCSQCQNMLLCHPLGCSQKKATRKNTAWCNSIFFSMWGALFPKSCVALCWIVLCSLALNSFISSIWGDDTVGKVKQELYKLRFILSSS